MDLGVERFRVQGLRDSGFGVGLRVCRFEVLSSLHIRVSRLHVLRVVAVAMCSQRFACTARARKNGASVVKSGFRVSGRW